MIPGFLVTLTLSAATLTLAQQKRPPRPSPPPVDWRFVKDGTLRFRLEYEESQRLEPLDSRGRPLTSAPRRLDVRRTVIVVRWRWTRRSRKARIAEIVLEKIEAFSLSGWEPRGPPPEDLPATVTLQDDRSGPSRADLVFRSTAAPGLRRFAGSAAAIGKFRSLLREAIQEMTRHLPPRRTPALGKGATWNFRRNVPLSIGGTLRSTAELEYVDRVVDSKTGRRLAHIEGSIRQEIPGAPPRIQRNPGLFPGTIRWIHDLDLGFPRLLESERIARIPQTDGRLPVIDTLTHTSRLRIELLGPRGK